MIPSPATIASIRRLEAEATQGPWHVSRLIGDGDHVAYGDALIAADEYGVAYCDSDAGNDAPLIVELRNAAVALCDAAEEAGRLRELLAEARPFVARGHEACSPSQCDRAAAARRIDHALASHTTAKEG